MKRICFVAVILALASFAAGAQTKYDLRGKDLPSSRRVTTTLRAVLPVYVGVSALVDSPGFSFPTTASGVVKSIAFGLEPVGLRFSAKGSPLESNIALRWQYMGLGAYSDSRMYATYLGVPLRVACRFGSSGKIFATASADLLLTRQDRFAQPLNRWRASVEGGISWGSWGIWTAYGLTPLLQNGGAANTLTFGIVVEV